MAIIWKNKESQNLRFAYFRLLFRFFFDFSKIWRSYVINIIKIIIYNSLSENFIKMRNTVDDHIQKCVNFFYYLIDKKIYE